MTIDQVLDLSGLSCPIPILKAKKALSQMAAGGMLEVIATDPAAPRDFDAFCRATGNIMVETSETAGAYRFVIRRSAP
ncbi:MAG: sulfurtransferase TusA family protein [Hyphomicrobium sp.]